jgi:hypothetical protein
MSRELIANNLVLDHVEGDQVVAEMRKKIAGILVEKQLIEEGGAINKTESLS